MISQTLKIGTPVIIEDMVSNTTHIVRNMIQFINTQFS